MKKIIAIGVSALTVCGISELVFCSIVKRTLKKLETTVNELKVHNVEGDESRYKLQTDFFYCIGQLESLKKDSEWRWELYGFNKKFGQIIADSPIECDFFQTSD